MLDFMEVSARYKNNGVLEVSPEFIIKRSSDLMIRGRDFYAIWDEEKGVWSTDEDDAVRLIDQELKKYINEHYANNPSVSPMYMRYSGSQVIDKWHKYCQKQMRDSYHTLDETLIFANDEVNKKDYASKRLPYALKPGSTESWDKLLSTLYSEEERHKIEWCIGSIVTGESKRIQKFAVFYGSAGTGKSTVLNIVQMLFDGYYSVFDAKALGSSSNQFALEPFKDNPLVAIQHDGDLSKIEDNTRINSLVSHELMTVNEKFKGQYKNAFKCFLLMGSNNPVKITDGKSGLLRRLIDISPTGKKLPVSEYNQVMKNIEFELGAIACKCRDVFLDNPGYYDDYTPTTMMGASNDFYNFMIESYHVFLKEDGTTLKAAYEMYKNYCDDSKVTFQLTKTKFKEELKGYFWNFEDRLNTDDGRIRNFYSGFRVDKFEPRKKLEGKIEKNKSESWIVLEEQESIFDKECSDCYAQYATSNETPSVKWDNCVTKLSEIDTKRLHYTKVPEVHVVVDFDIKDENGNKSLELNMEAASLWPPTYAELSKGGAGLHLHYIYTGDVTKISRVYSDDIEIKIFTGNSSLRRKLTKCNNLPIATISSGLPLKEEKGVIDKNIIQSEKGLRTTIKKCLCKEVHAGTKPNVDFIFKILNDAYESGMKYDVTDMYNAILAFAANSTHQAEYCMSLVDDMHFKSDEPSEAIPEDNEKSIAFYDIEVFPNLFLVNWKLAGEGNPVVRMINPSPADIEGLLNYRLIGFNCRRYDNHILYARLMGYTNAQLYDLSQGIINNKSNCMFSEAYNISYTDVYDFASAGNKKSLKKLEIEMGIHHQELGLPWDQPVPEEKWVEVAEYCDNDVIATEAAFHYLSADWTARQILADLADATVNDTTNTLTTKIIFGKNKKPQGEFCYRNLSEPVMHLEQEVYDFLAEACPVMMSQTHGKAGSLLPYFPGYEYKFGKSTYRGENVGEGGYVYAEPGMYGDVALLDIASMHPHSTIAECLFGPRFTKAYRDIVEGRVSIKHEAWDIVNFMLDGKLTKFIQKVINGEMTSGQLADALKTAINSVYGLTAAGFDNPFRDPRNIDNIVAKRGALFMVDLKHEVQKRGYTVAHIKTDSIKIPDATPEIIQFVKEFGEKYGYTFEHEATYEKMCLVNDAVYVCKFATIEHCIDIYGGSYLDSDPSNCAKNKKKGGKWDATGKQFAVPYLFKKLFSHEQITFDDMCETFAVSKGDLYLDMNENLPNVTDYEKQLDKYETQYKKGQLSDIMFQECTADLVDKIAEGHDLHFVGRVGQFCPIKSGCNGGVLYRINEGKKYAAPGSSGYRWLESEKVKVLGKEDCIDKSFYENLINDAVEVISKYGDFEWFVSDDPYISKGPDWMRIPDVDEDELPFK